MPKVPLVLAALAGVSSAGIPKYQVDRSFKPEFPHGVGLFAAVDVSGDKVFVCQRDGAYKSPVVVVNKHTGKYLYEFGSEDIAQTNNASRCNKLPKCWGCHGLSIQPRSLKAGRPEETVWITDFFNHTVLSYWLGGELYGKAGRPGVASPDKDKFDAVADTAFYKDTAYFADGDGGANNRIEAWAAASGKPEHVKWVSPAKPPSQRKVEEYNNPHGLWLHEASKRLLVADRQHQRIAIVNPETGVDERTLKCPGLNFNASGELPFTVRTFKTKTQDLMFVAVTGGHQRLYVVDVSSLAKTGACTSVVQRVDFGLVNTTKPGEVTCNTPHSMGVDRRTGDVYVACVGEPGSAFVRLRQHHREETVVV